MPGSATTTPDRSERKTKCPGEDAEQDAFKSLASKLQLPGNDSGDNGRNGRQCSSEQVVAVKRSRLRLDSEVEIRSLKAHYSALTMRERQVMTLVISGMLNKQVGDELGITEVTLKFHRGNLMRKMKADSFAELVSMATRLRVKGFSGAKVPSAR